MNSSISEYDQKCEIRNAEPEIGTDGSSQTRWNPQVQVYRSGFGPPTVSRLGFWTGLEPNRPVFAVQTRTAGGLPGPVANTKSGCNPANRILSSLSVLRIHPVVWFWHDTSKLQLYSIVCFQYFLLFSWLSMHWISSLSCAILPPHYCNHCFN